METYTQLNPRRQAFVRYYTDPKHTDTVGNIGQAHKRAGYAGSSAEIHRKNGWKILSKDDVKQAIVEYQHHIVQRDESELQRLDRELWEYLHFSKSKNSTQGIGKALDLLGKRLAAFTQVTKSTNDEQDLQRQQLTDAEIEACRDIAQDRIRDIMRKQLKAV